MLYPYRYHRSSDKMPIFPFMKLPVELRLMLWRFTWTDRVVVIQLGKMATKGARPDSSRRGQQDCNEKIIHTKAQLPCTLLVNGESRYETLKHYKAAFQLPGYENRIYFRQGDIPCVESHQLADFSGCRDLAEAEEVMITWNSAEYVFQMSKMEDDHWSEEFFRKATRLESGDIMEICPKIHWLYWANDCRQKINPGEARTLKSPELIWSEAQFG